MTKQVPQEILVLRVVLGSDIFYMQCRLAKCPAVGAMAMMKNKKFMQY